MSQHPSCTTCGMPAGNCRHTTEGQVTPRPLSRAMSALLGKDPTRPQVADAALRQDPPASTAPAGGADLLDDATMQRAMDVAGVVSVGYLTPGSVCSKPRRNNQLYDPKCRELAEYFAAGNEPPLTDEQLDDLSQDIQDAVESYLDLVDSEGQS